MRGSDRKPKATKTAKKHYLECPACGGALTVIYSRPKAGSVGRRRKCQKCGARFTTAEKFVNVPASSSTGKAPDPLSITALLESLHTTVADLTKLVTLPPGDPADDSDPTHAG